MSNFPLFNNHLKLSSEELLQYIFIFPKHDILFTKKTNLILTYHRYSDGMLIKFTWNLLKEVNFLSSRKEKNSNSVKELLEENFISLEKGEIFYHSDANSYCDQNTFDKFSTIIDNKERTLTSEEYQYLEYPVKEQVSIPNYFFEEIIKRNQNIFNFERYLAERNSKQSES